MTITKQTLHGCHMSRLGINIYILLIIEQSSALNLKPFKKNLIGSLIIQEFAARLQSEIRISFDYMGETPNAYRTGSFSSTRCSRLMHLCNFVEPFK